MSPEINEKLTIVEVILLNEILPLFDKFILTKQNCRICNIEPNGIVKDKTWAEKSWYIYNGIDRIDNNKGYLFENCGTMCKICNRAKLDLTEEEFQFWIKNVIRHNTK